MSDPIKDLENFNREGLSVTPLDPSEVRRLGDRRRQRRNAAAAVAGVAAVAVIATPLALLAAGRDSGSAPDPGPATDPTGSVQPTTVPPTTWVTTIPDGFPLMTGVENDPEGASEPTVSPDGEGLGNLSLCNRKVWPATAVDRLAGEDPAMDFHYNRELLVFPSDVDAILAMTRIRDGVEACASETTTDGAIPGEEFELLHTLHRQETGAAETVTWTDAYADGSIGTKVFQFVRVGNAVTGTQVSSESNKDGVASQLPAVTAGSSSLVDELRIFRGTAGTSTGSLRPTDLLTAEQTLPAGSWAVASTGPADETGALTVCQESALAQIGASATIRRTFSPLGEGGSGNSLMTVVGEFPDAEGAAAAYTALGEELALCRAIEQAGFEVSHEPDVVVPLTGVVGEARVASASWVDPGDGTNAVHLLMNGTALVGKRVVLVSSLTIVQDYWTRDMEQMIATAAALVDTPPR